METSDIILGAQQHQSNNTKCVGFSTQTFFRSTVYNYFLNCFLLYGKITFRFPGTFFGSFMVLSFQHIKLTLSEFFSQQKFIKCLIFHMCFFAGNHWSSIHFHFVGSGIDKNWIGRLNDILPKPSL